MKKPSRSKVLCWLFLDIPGLVLKNREIDYLIEEIDKVDHRELCSEAEWRVWARDRVARFRASPLIQW